TGFIREAGFGGEQNQPRYRDCCVLSNNIVLAILKVRALIFNNVAWTEILSVLDTARKTEFDSLLLDVSSTGKDLKMFCMQLLSKYFLLW
ncbi:hypothetical protein A2U01_0016138, partial [Trifolium medium]|nr:hypothetical protein [Trifolium medium]